MNPFQFLLDRLRRQRLPMRVCRIFQMFRVFTHAFKVRIGQPLLIPLTLPLMEIHMHLPHIIKQITDTDHIRLVLKLISECSHGLPCIVPLSPNQWEADTLSGDNADYACQHDTINIQRFHNNVKSIFSIETQRPPTSHKLKHGALAGRLVNYGFLGYRIYALSLKVPPDKGI